MKAITLRFSDSTYQMISDEAANEGISISQFLREAALTKTVITKARNGDYTLAQQLGIDQAVRSIAQAEDRRRKPKPSGTT